MAEQAQQKVQNAMKGLVEDLDRAHLRPLEKAMHECAVKCCDDQQSSMEQVHGCVAECQKDTVRAQRYLQGELERFSESLSRCVMQCQDDAKDKMPAGGAQPSNDEMAKIKAGFETCALKCTDVNVAKIPDLKTRLSAALKANRY